MLIRFKFSVCSNSSPPPNDLPYMQRSFLASELNLLNFIPSMCDCSDCPFLSRKWPCDPEVQSYYAECAALVYQTAQSQGTSVPRLWNLLWGSLLHTSIRCKWGGGAGKIKTLLRRGTYLLKFQNGNNWTCLVSWYSCETSV